MSIHEKHTLKKNTRKKHTVKGKVRGRPPRTDVVDLGAIGSRVRELRGAITQEAFAEKLGISQAQLSKYELGQTALPLAVLLKLSADYDATMEWILTGRGKSEESC